MLGRPNTVLKVIHLHEVDCIYKVCTLLQQASGIRMSKDDAVLQKLCRESGKVWQPEHESDVSLL